MINSEDIFYPGAVHNSRTGEMTIVLRELDKVSEAELIKEGYAYSVVNGEEVYNVTIDGAYYTSGQKHEKDLILELTSSGNENKDAKVVFPEFTIGCDPELIIHHKSVGCVSAEAFIDCEKYTLEHAFGEYGLDGAPFTMELRPKEANTPLELARHIQLCLLQACNDNPHLAELNWMAGAAKESINIDGYRAIHPIGGHIHFGIPQKPFMVKMLDRYLALPYALLEDKDEAFLRKKEKSYGRLSDARPQNWGWEYRTPSSWLYSPALAIATLSVAKHIINQFRIKGNDVLRRTAVTRYLGEDIYDPYMAHDEVFMRHTFEDVWAELLSWPMENTLKEGIEAFQTLIESGFKVDDQDIKKNWGIIYNVD